MVAEASTWSQPRVCVHCGGSFRPLTPQQRYCYPCRELPEVIAARKAEQLAHRRANTATVADGVKTCACGATFPVEFNSRGQMTSRKLCDGCREKRQQRWKNVRRRMPKGAPRCVDCTAVAGVEWGTTLSLDENGRCPSCAKWRQRVLAEKTARRRGHRFRGGLWFAPDGSPGGPQVVPSAPISATPPAPTRILTIAGDRTGAALPLIGQACEWAGFDPKDVLHGRELEGILLFRQQLRRYLWEHERWTVGEISRLMHNRDVSAPVERRPANADAAFAAYYAGVIAAAFEHKEPPAAPEGKAND